MKVIITIFLGVITVLTSCNTTAQTEDKTTQTEVKATKKSVTKPKVEEATIAKNINLSDFDKVMADRKPVLLDVRTAQEFAAGHIDGAINIDVMQPSFKAEVAKLNSQDKAIMIYCRTGGRSTRAMGMLKKEGYKEMYNLMGGFNGYSKRK